MRGRILLDVALRNVLRERERNVGTCEPATIDISRVRCIHFLNSEVKKSAHQHCKRDRASTKRQDPLNKWTRSSKHSPDDHHAALPSIELIKRNHISNRERQIE